MDYKVKNKHTGELRDVFIKHERHHLQEAGGAVNFNLVRWLEDEQGNQLFSSEKDPLSPGDIDIGMIVIIDDQYYDVVYSAFAP